MRNLAPLAAVLRKRWPPSGRALTGVTGIWLGCFLVLTGVWGLFIWTIANESDQMARHQETQVRLQAKGFAEFVALHLLLVDRVIINARENYHETGAFPSGTQVAPELGASAPILLEMAIADHTGSVIEGTVRSFKGVKVDDRDYFRGLAADPQDRLYLSQTTVRGRLSGKVGLPVARPILSAKGEFRGVIAANIDLAVLRRYFDASDIFERRSIVAIVGSHDGLVRARFSKNLVTSGESVITSPVWKPDAEEVSRTQRAKSVFDGLERLIGIHRVSGYPLSVGVAVPTESVWRLAVGSSDIMALAMAVAFSFALVMLARSRARQEVKQEEHLRQLAASRQKEYEANQVKSNFLAAVSHDLRTPLNSILGFSELIRDDPGGRDTGKFAGLIHSSAKHLHALVSTLLDLAKIEAGKMEVDLEDVDLRKLLVTATDTHRVSIRKDVTLSLKISPPGPIIVHTDRTKLVEVLNNVLHNAIKFTESGEIEVTSFPVQNGILVRVTDSGRGIADKDISRVFSRFNSVGLELEQEKGSGLGLALSKSLIELLGGSITLQSQLGVGTQVDIFLPKVN